MRDLDRLIFHLDTKLNSELTPMKQALIVDTLLYLNVEGRSARIDHANRIKSKYYK